MQRQNPNINIMILVGSLYEITREHALRPTRPEDPHWQKEPVEIHLADGFHFTGIILICQWNFILQVVNRTKCFPNDAQIIPK